MSDKTRSVDFKMLWTLFITFFKIGAFTFGGGYAMIPLIEREMVGGKGWINQEDIVDILAVSQSLPGAIAINSATFIGYKIAGMAGAISAALGVILPSVIVITIIASIFVAFKENMIVQKVFAGIRSAVVALIAVAAWNIGKSSIKDAIGLIIAAGAFIASAIFDIHAIYIILVGIMLGLIIQGINDRRTIQQTYKNDRAGKE
ncbi:chromate transporter [Mahella australiensis]|uniref:Chromate transporter n=1 Tax=Mahella australiensis (strain DSM 15567 / CIP 107919 / 50-1 BON) TaxID=697281 RepID=F4A1Y4_MAHA5|nr:chromate transporter [Mahella australiensis]AEE96100.1 Chromate transporter [Mahella australiensis 50-1 BON]